MGAAKMMRLTIAMLVLVAACDLANAEINVLGTELKACGKENPGGCTYSPDDAGAHEVHKGPPQPLQQRHRPRPMVAAVRRQALVCVHLGLLQLHPQARREQDATALQGYPSQGAGGEVFARQVRAVWQDEQPDGLWN